MKHLTAEEDLQAEMDLYNKELTNVTNNFAFRVILIFTSTAIITFIGICTYPDLYFYSLVQYAMFSLALLTWDFINTNKEANNILENSCTRTNTLLNKHYPIGE